MFARVPIILTSRVDLVRAWPPRGCGTLCNARVAPRHYRRLNIDGNHSRRQRRFSVKFQVFAIEPSGALARRIKGQMDGIGTRPRLRASDAQGSSIVDRKYAPEAIPSVPAALQMAAAWLREEQNIDPCAIGHRVVHGGPDYDRPVLIDAKVLADLERYNSLAPLHQPHNLAPIRSILTRFPQLPQIACFDTAFHRGHSAIADHYAIPERSTPRRAPLRVSRLVV